MVKVGFRKHIKLSVNEFNQLKSVYGIDRTNEYIQKLDDYIETTAKEYSSHFETLKEWLNKDQVTPAEKITKDAYGEYDGTNKEELERLRKEYHIQVCPFCKQRFKLRYMVEWKIGKTPHAIYDCECGASGYEEIIIENGRKVIYCGGDDKNIEWNENTIKERLEKDITATLNEKYGKD